MERELMRLLAGAERLEIEGGLSLRLLSAQEVLEARREADGLAQEEREGALCANACLLSRALERGERAAFADGAAVLAGLTAVQIAELTGRWAEFTRRENPGPEAGEERLERLKKAWSTRLTRAFGGVCSVLLGRCPPRRGPER